MGVRDEGSASSRLPPEEAGDPNEGEVIDAQVLLDRYRGKEG